ncbi:restriction endonuclease subunit S [Rothia endophytica]|uniref:restriction endonuclease subunit S n=1 Tax=Rothia endophytica TaxID=1324766 RepID=UPI001F00701A|nr:restriction endonuclease subunit S [Rothia endophytica]
MRQLAFEPIQTTWGDLVTVKQGKYVAKSDLASSRSEDTPVPTVGANGVLGYVPKASYQRRVPLVTCRGSNCGLIQYPLEPVWVNNNAMALDAGTDEENSFIYYLALNTDFNDVVSGSAQPQITAGPLKSKAVSVPPREYWRGIAATLGALDDKIESNRRAIDILDRIMSTRVGNYLAHADIGQLRALESLGTLVTGKTPSTKDKGNFGGSIPFVTISELSAHHIVQQSARTLSNAGAELVKGAVVPAGSIAISCIATVGECGIIGTESVTNQQINTLIPNLSVINTGFAYYLFRSLKPELLAAGGGGSVYTNVSKGRLSKIKVAVPSLNEQEMLVPAEFMAEMLHLQEESQQLSTLRDSLLPELLSGCIRAADVEVA